MSNHPKAFLHSLGSGVVSFIVVVCLAVPCCVNADPVITPGKIEVTLDPGECTSELISVATGAAPIPKLDVVLMIDVTGSMSGVIGEVTRSAESIVRDVETLVPDATFALVTLADYEGEGGGLFGLFGEYGAAGDYPWQLDQDFTTDAERIRRSLEAIRLMNGGDVPESYLRALYESQFLNWRTGSRRVVLLFGDSFAHDPDPGRDVQENTGDDLTQETVINQLAIANITVLPIYTSYPDFYTAIAQGTGGRAVQMRDTAQVPQIIQELVEETVSTIRVLTLDIPAAGQDWLTWTPTDYRGVAPEEQREFTLEICAPNDASGGKHTFDVQVTGDGATLGEIPVVVHVGGTPIVPVTSWCPLPPLTVGGREVNTCLLLIPVLLLLLLGLLFWILSRRRPTGAHASRPEERTGHTAPPQGKPKPATPPTGASIQHGKSTSRPTKR